jgi:hypothetical protein
MADLTAWMREQRAKLSRGNDVAMLKRWIAFTLPRRRPHLPIQQRGGAWRALHRFCAQVVVVLRQGFYSKIVWEIHQFVVEVSAIQG